MTASDFVATLAKAFEDEPPSPASFPPPLAGIFNFNPIAINRIRKIFTVFRHTESTT
jgi:hypothetical protein